VLHYFYFIVLLLSFPSQARTSTSHDLVCAAIVASEDSHATVQFFLTDQCPSPVSSYWDEALFGWWFLRQLLIRMLICCKRKTLLNGWPNRANTRRWIQGRKQKRSFCCRRVVRGDHVRPARFGLAESCEAVFQLFLLGWLHATVKRGRTSRLWCFYTPDLQSPDSASS
jgi:hypothetical protein